MTRPELEEKLRQLGLLEHQLRDAMPLIDSYLKEEVERAERRVLKIADSPCECGRDHKATPVRSVTGVLTSYCQFSRVTPSELTPPAQQEKK